MSTAFTDIGSALDKHLDEMPSAPSTAWENKKYEPVKGTLYLRATRLPGEGEQATLGDGGEDLNEGIYQIDVFAPSDDWKKDALAMADLIANRFKRGAILTYNSVNVRIKKVWIDTGRNSDGWYHIPVNVSYYSHTQAR